MKIIVKGTFRRDYLNKPRIVRVALDEKIIQIEKAKDISQITGLILLTGFSHHYRIKVDIQKKKYRIGAIIRSNTIYLIRFQTRKAIYSSFP